MEKKEQLSISHFVEIKNEARKFSIVRCSLFGIEFEAPGTHCNFMLTRYFVWAELRSVAYARKINTKFRPFVIMVENV